jgi:hypothetical protein
MAAAWTEAGMPAAQRRFAPVPVVAHGDIRLDRAERRRLEALAGRILTRNPRLADGSAFGDDVRSGCGPWPNLIIEDHSEIRLFETAGTQAYAYRALLLGGDGDVVVLDLPRVASFEAYCREHLKLGRAEILCPREGPPQRPLSVRSALDELLVGQAAARARAAGGLNVVPYMGTGGAWRLAAEIARGAGTEVRVAAPSPGLARWANDKVRFAECVRETLGQAGLPASEAVFGTAALIHRLMGMARRSPTVAVKIPDSASSSGNLVFAANALAGHSARSLRDRVLGLLAARGWQGQFPLMVTHWEAPLISSPSAQLWIPAREHGPPVLEGIFEQLVIGERREFAGAAPAALPAAVQARIARDVARLGYILQCLGYYGRCSFDGILIGRSTDRAALHWVECNGRWGGVSIPMTLANRLTGDWAKRPFVIADRAGLNARPCDFDDALPAFGADLFTPGEGAGGVIFLSPSRLAAGTGFEIMAVDRTAAEARARLARAVDRLEALLGVTAASPPQNRRTVSPSFSP